MEQKIKSIIAGVTNETLEKLAFFFAFPDDERDGGVPPPAITGRVEFSGYFPGSLAIRLSTSSLSELSANMLGLDEDDDIPAQDQQDAFKEVINVICGNALPAIAGDQVEFNIGAPEILSESDVQTEVSKENCMCVVKLMIDDGFCDVYFFMEGQLLENILGKENEQMQQSE